MAEKIEVVLVDASQSAQPPTPQPPPSPPTPPNQPAQPSPSAPAPSPPPSQPAPSQPAPSPAPTGPKVVNQPAQQPKQPETGKKEQSALITYLSRATAMLTKSLSRSTAGRAVVSGAKTFAASTGLKKLFEDLLGKSSSSKTSRPSSNPPQASVGPTVNNQPQNAPATDDSGETNAILGQLLDYVSQIVRHLTGKEPDKNEPAPSEPTAPRQRLPTVAPRQMPVKGPSTQPTPQPQRQMPQWVTKAMDGFGKLFDTLKKDFKGDMKWLGDIVGKSRVGRAGRAIAKRVANSKIGRAASGAVRRGASAIGKRVAQSKIGQAAVGGTKKAVGAVGRVLGFGGATSAAAGGSSGAAAGAAGAATAAGGAAAGLTALIPPLAALVVIVGGAVLAFATLYKALSRQADELEMYSAAISGARMEAESRALSARIERADKIGAPVAQIEAAKARLNEAIYELMTEIYSEMAEYAPLLEMIIDFATANVRGIESAVNALQLIHAVLTFKPIKAGMETVELQESLKKMNQAIAEIFVTSGGTKGQANWVLGQNPLGPMQQMNIKPNQANPGLGPGPRI